MDGAGKGEASEDRAGSEIDAPAAESAPAVSVADARAATGRDDVPPAPPAPRVGAPLVEGRVAEALAILSGVFYFLAFAGFDQWWLTFVALAPLWIAFQGQSTKRAMFLGLLCGLTMNLGGFYWLVNMLRTFSGFPTALCLVFVTIICAYQGGRLAFFGWLFGRARNRGWPAAPLFAAAFATSELLFPLLFPWYYAATVHQVPVLVQVAELGGPILVGLVLLAVNLAVAEPVRVWLARRSSVATAAERTLDRRIIGVGVASLALALLFGAVRIPMVKAKIAAAEPAKVGMVQANMGLMAKREDPGEGLRRHRRLTADLRAKGIDFVVWSESSVMSAIFEDRAPAEFKNRFASSLGVPAIFGAVLVRPDNQHPKGYRLFNTAIATDVRGEKTGRYDKQFLLAFGEYLPFGDTFPILYKWSPNSGNFSAGRSLDPVDLVVGGTTHKVAVLICYEDILPGFTNKLVSHGDPDLLVNITNDAWFGDTAEPWEHLALAKFRAVEHRRYLVRSTNSGVSAIVDPLGGIVTNTKTFVTDAQVGEIRWLRGTTVYEILGDVPWYALAVVVVVLAFRKRNTRAIAAPARAS